MLLAIVGLSIVIAVGIEIHVAQKPTPIRYQIYTSEFNRQDIMIVNNSNRTLYNCTLNVYYYKSEYLESSLFDNVTALGTLTPSQTIVTNSTILVSGLYRDAFAIAYGYTA